MKTDYPELEGKVIVSNGEEWFVAGCNYSLGITVEHATQRGRYLFCIHGLSSPAVKDGRIEKLKSQMTYRRVFHELVRQLQTGVLDWNKVRKVATDGGANFTSHKGKDVYCPYKE